MRSGGRWGCNIMNSSILVAIITVVGSLLAASITFYLTKNHQIEAEWRHEKLNHYKVLLSSISELAEDGINRGEANKRFLLAFNTIALVAPQYVIKALVDYQYETRTSNSNPSLENHDRLLKELLLAIRKDIGLSTKDNPDTFIFHLIASKPIGYNTVNKIDQTY